jgi:hypothetical protein
MTTLQEFIEEHGIEATAERAASNPNMPSVSVPGTRHYLVTLTRPGVEPFQVPFTVGSALSDPDAAMVLDCLASDAASVDGVTGFEEWADNFGLDPDSRRAESTYGVIVAQAEALYTFLGGTDAYDTLLYSVERE